MSTSRASCFHESSPMLYVIRILTIPSDVSPNTAPGEAQRSCDGVEQESSGRHSCLLHAGAGLTTPQEINVQNMNVELVAQMFKNYQSNVLFHLEGQSVY
jgi:hypothetical protein